MIKNNFLLLLVFLNLFLCHANAQKGSSTDHFFRVPSDLGLVLSAQRESLPLKVENVALVTDSEARRIKCAYQVRNVGDEAIRAVEVTIITNFLFRPSGGGRMEIYSEVMGLDRNENGQIYSLKPGESTRHGRVPARFLDNKVVTQISNQPSQIRTKFVVALVITKIEFQSGKVLDLRSDADDLVKLWTDGIGIR